jgi:hypothetical protein
MSILVFVVLLSAMIVLFAVAADRSARANRRWRAGLLNLCGLFLLAVGVLALFAWSHHGHVVSVQIGRSAYGAQPVWEGSPENVPPSMTDQPIRSLRDEDHPAETPTPQPDVLPPDAPAEPAEMPAAPAEEPATPAVEPAAPADEPAEQPAEEPATPAEQPATPAEQPATPAVEPATPAEQPATPAEDTPAEQPAAPAEQPTEQPAEQPAELPAEATGEFPEPQTGVQEPVADQTKADVAGELSTSPQGQVEIDYAARPEWVDRPPREEGPVHQVAVCSGPYLRSHDAHKELQQQLKRVTDEYINEFVGQDSASRWISWDTSRIGRELVAARNHFEEKVISPSFGVMYQSHALLEFGPEFHRQVEESWRQIQARARLVKMALGAAAVLGSLMLLFGFFQADTATRGFYSGRLKFVTAVAILGLIVCGVYLARSIPWLWP